MFERNLITREDLMVARNVFSGDKKWRFITITPPEFEPTIKWVRDNLPTTDEYAAKYKVSTNGFMAFSGEDASRPLKEGEQLVLFVRPDNNNWIIGTDAWPFTDEDGNTFTTVSGTNRDIDYTGSRIFITQMRCGKRIWFEVVDDHIKAQARSTIPGPVGPRYNPGDNTLSGVKLKDGTVEEGKLAQSVQVKLNRADTNRYVRYIKTFYYTDITHEVSVRPSNNQFMLNNGVIEYTAQEFNFVPLPAVNTDYLRLTVMCITDDNNTNPSFIVPNFVRYKGSSTTSSGGVSEARVQELIEAANLNPTQTARVNALIAANPEEFQDEDEVNTLITSSINTDIKPYAKVGGPAISGWTDIGNGSLPERLLSVSARKLINAVPTSADAGKYSRVKADGSGYENADPPSDGGDVSTSELNEALATRDSEISTLSEIAFNNTLPESIRRLAHLLMINQNTGGKWQLADSPVIKPDFTANLPAGATTTYTSTIPYNNKNFDGTEELGGAVSLPNITANNKNLGIAFNWRQLFAGRPVNAGTSGFNSNGNDVMLQIGATQLIRWNVDGIDVFIGTTAGTNRPITRFLGVGSTSIESTGSAYEHTFVETFSTAPNKLRFTAHTFIGDESIERVASSSADITNISTNSNVDNGTVFTIVLPNRTNIVGKAIYHNNQITVKITSGLNVGAGNHTQLDMLSETSHTINYPARQEFAGILASASLDDGISEIFTKHIDTHVDSVFVLQKQFDYEADGPTNLMRLYYRINGHTGYVNLERPRSDFMGAPMILAGAPVGGQSISKYQVFNYEGNLDANTIRGINVDELGAGQVIHLARNDTIKIAAEDIKIVDSQNNERSLEHRGLIQKPLAPSNISTEIRISSSDYDEYDYITVYAYDGNEFRVNRYKITDLGSANRYRIAGTTDFTFSFVNTNLIKAQLTITSGIFNHANLEKI